MIFRCTYSIFAVYVFMNHLLFSQSINQSISCHNPNRSMLKIPVKKILFEWLLNTCQESQKNC